MTVKELIEFLKTKPEELDVAYQCCSEHKILDQDEMEIKELKCPRPDGWIHDTWREEDVPKKKYLLMPGN